MSPQRDLTSYDSAAWMSLGHAPTSEAANELGKELIELLFPAPKTRGRGRPPDTDGRRRTVLAIVADFVSVTGTRSGRWLYRELSPNTFTGRSISYRAFVAAVQEMERVGFLKKLPGYSTTDSAFGQVERYGRATRWQAQATLFELCDEHGISALNYKDHFHLTLPEQVLVLKQSSMRDGPNKIQGRRVRFPSTARSEELSSEVKEINAFLAQHDIGNAVHRGFHRMFGKGDDPENYEWNMHGRLYSQGEGNYQTMKSELRSAMTLDGKPVVEIDIRASHLTIFLALTKADFDPTNGDPYEVFDPRDGIQIPREVVKSWMLKTLGSGQLATRWPTTAVSKYRETTGGRTLGTDYPARVVSEAVSAKYPALTNLATKPVDTHYLMFRESQVIVAVMLELLRIHKVPSLPVHDSLIVPQEHQELVEEVLGRVYASKIGIRPALSTTLPDKSSHPSCHS